MNHEIKSPRKLIEVALPLDAINAACAREKSIRHGHPSTLHLWWARRPLAAARAILFAQLVNDPGYHQGGGFKYGKNKTEAALERQRLFKIIQELVSWENSNNEEVLGRARAEIRRSWAEICQLNKDHADAATIFDPERLPNFHDPFAGGGAIPLEAQRLGLPSHASDLNPIAVLINKAMIEVPSRFSGVSPVGPSFGTAASLDLDLQHAWSGLTGLSEDVRRYGAWVKAQAAQRIGALYPNVKVTSDIARDRPDLNPFVDQTLTVIAWIWARTVKSPNPAFSHVHVPLVSSFVLSKKPGKEFFVQPLIDGDAYSFSVKAGCPPTSAESGTKAGGRGANFRCLVSGASVSSDYIKSEGQAARMGQRLMAIVAEGPKGRVYLPPTAEMEKIALSANPNSAPTGAVPERLTGGTCVPYGLKEWGDLFTRRQLVALNTFTALVSEAHEVVKQDAIKSGFEDDGVPLAAGGKGATAYADAVTLYLAFIVDKLAEAHSTICTWSSATKNELVVSTFRRQALPMTWDFAEANPFADSSGSLEKTCEAVARTLRTALCSDGSGSAYQANAASDPPARNCVVSTDPPYYDNISYADLSDFFYVWLRSSLRKIFPELLATVATPKKEELVATAYRHGSRVDAEAFFLKGISNTMRLLAQHSNPAFPVTIYYAFKQAETETDEGTYSTGWETFLDGVLKAGFAISGTWPLRTEREGRSTGIETNALASSIVLVCRKRAKDAAVISRREFIRELNAVLPVALDEMTKGAGEEASPIAPVDLSQSIIGPGMAIFSKYNAVLEADGSEMSVRTALQLINRFLAEDDFDSDTQFCLHWFEQHGWSEGPFGDAETLSRAKGTSVEGVRYAGVIESGSGKVRLRKWLEYPTDWDPRTDDRNPVWETLHHLVRVLMHDGESAAGKLLAGARAKAEASRQLAYRLYTLCERNGWAEDARAYNDFITSWTAIEAAANASPVDKQLSVFE